MNKYVTEFEPAFALEFFIIDLLNLMNIKTHPMKTLAIASLTGAVILFVYLALVHTILPVHESDFKYTPAQDSILKVLNNSGLEEGFYFVPYYPPGSSHEVQEKAMENMTGKPAAIINYYAEIGGFDPVTFVMSFIYNLLSVLILCIALAAASGKLTSFGQRLWFVMLFALFVIFSQIMMQYTWVGIPMHYTRGLIIDQLGGFLLVGIWLAWYYGRASSAKAAGQ